MKNSIPDGGVKVFGGTANQDLTSQLHDHLDGMFDDELEQSVAGLKRLIDASSAQLLVLVAELDRRQVPRTEHGLSTTAWLRHFCRMTATEASGTVKTARALTRMPEVAEQAVAGNIVPNGVRLLAQARDKHPDEFAHHETVFADVATYLDARDLRRAVAHWEQQVDYAAALRDTKRQHELRRVFDSPDLSRNVGCRGHAQSGRRPCRFDCAAGSHRPGQSRLGGSPQYGAAQRRRPR